MDLLQGLWDRLRAQGHTLGPSYMRTDGGGQLIVVDSVAMSLPDARAVADERVTVQQIAEARQGSAL